MFDKIKSDRKLTATVLVLCMILSGFSILSVGMYGNSVSAILIEETESMNGTLIWNDTYFLTDPVNIMQSNPSDDLENHFPTVYKDKVAWTENVDGYQSIVYYNMTTGVHEYINGSIESGNFTKPVLIDNYLICRHSNTTTENSVIFNYTDLDYASVIATISVDLLATDFYDANNEYVTWIDTNDLLNVLDLSTIYDVSPTINQYNETTTFVLNEGLQDEQNLCPIGNPSINENNDIIFPFSNTTNINENYGLIKFNADTELWEVLRWKSYIDIYIELTYYGMYSDDIWFGSEKIELIDTNGDNIINVFNVETDETIYETELSWNGDPIAGGYYPLGFDGMIGTSFLWAYTDDNWTNYRDELQLINLETGENYTIKQVWNIDTWDNYKHNNTVIGGTIRYNVYAYPNGSYAIVDCNYAFNPTRSYTPDGQSPSIMVMFLHPITEPDEEEPPIEEPEEELDVYQQLSQTLQQILIQMVLPVIVLIVVFGMIINMMKTTFKSKKKK